MAKLILLRHLKSQWNLENRFTGWVDVPLMRADFQIPALNFNIVYTSPLIRNLHTVLKVFEKKDKYPIFRHLKGKMKRWAHFEELDQSYVLVYVSEVLNERYYGKLQGLNKEETMKKYGKEKVQLWRRSYNIAPPGGESLKDVFKRTTPFYKKYIEKDLKEGKNVLIVASHNSLRAIVKYVEKISDKEIINLEIPYSGLIEYEFNRALKLKNKKSYNLFEN